ncbi:MAG: DUF4398 domain-containing protein [Deltaproteobacteria bacterium]|nr:DUF4398 domain-containing protein [Deltaproteobacteria bacterium]
MLTLPFAAFACAGEQPVQKETDSKAAVRAAEEVGAEGLPRSALYLDLAKQQIARAEKLMKDGEQKQAELTLDRARADAELAIALAKADDERVVAEETAKRLEQMQKGI